MNLLHSLLFRMSAFGFAAIRKTIWSLSWL